MLKSWNVEMLKVEMLKMLKSWTIESWKCWKCWNVKCWKCWKVETWNVENVEMLKVEMLNKLKSWKSKNVIFKFFNFSPIQHFNILKSWNVEGWNVAPNLHVYLQLGFSSLSTRNRSPMFMHIFSWASARPLLLLPDPLSLSIPPARIQLGLFNTCCL